MKPASKLMLNVDSLRVEEIYFGDERYIIEGECSKCGECCHKCAPFLLKRGTPQCQFLNSLNECSIHITKPWFCRLFPYDLECFKMLPESCTLKLRRVH